MASLMCAASGIVLNRVSRSRSACTDWGKKPRGGASAGNGARARPVAEIRSDENSVRISGTPRRKKDAETYSASFSPVMEISLSVKSRGSGFVSVARGAVLINVGFFSALIVRDALERNPAFGPVANLLQSVLEFEAFLGKLVFNPNRGVGDHSANNQSFALKGAKALRQHSIGEVRDCTLDSCVARFSLKEGLKNGARPAATDELDSPMKPGAYL